MTLNGAERRPGAARRRAAPAARPAADNELVVERDDGATATTARGCTAAVDPADGKHYVYGHLFLDAAPRVFACFDQPDLKAPYDVTRHRPGRLGRRSATARPPGRAGRWTLATTQPLATYFVTVCAGPYASVRDEHDGIPLGVHARASLRDAPRAAGAGRCSR